MSFPAYVASWKLVIEDTGPGGPPFLFSLFYDLEIVEEKARCAGFWECHRECFELKHYWWITIRFGSESYIF